MKRTHTSKGRPVVYFAESRDGRFRLARVARNGVITHHPATYANSQAARRAARDNYPGVRIERVN